MDNFQMDDCESRFICVGETKFGMAYEARLYVSAGQLGSGQGNTVKRDVEAIRHRIKELNALAGVSQRIVDTVKSAAEQLEAITKPETQQEKI